MLESILNELTVNTVYVHEYMTNHYIRDIMDAYVFQQIWGSTALGFDGWGGSSMTPAWTHVIATYDGKFRVFFGGRFAYCVEYANEAFKEDLEKRDMKSVSEAKVCYVLS
jgi:hypothetical protein